jgi:hypothetical protein
MKKLGVFAMVFLLVSCGGSKTSMVRMDLQGHQGAFLNVMPFNSNFERAYYDDMRLQKFEGFLTDYIQHKIQERSGAFTYTFDDSDLANLRTSVIKSLREAKHYSQVRDIQPAQTLDLPDGLRLFIDFERMGVSQKISFIVEIVGEIKITDSAGKELGKRAFHIREKGTWTLGAGKNKAIEQFVREVEELLKIV